MKKIVLLCIFTLSANLICLAQTNQTESLTITAYYPSPYGVYRNLKLTPTDAVPEGSFLSPGVIYYNNSTDRILYYNKTDKWVNLTAGGGGGGGNETYWNETSAHNIYNTNNGFVGIGTNTPDWPLEVMYSSADKDDPIPFRLIKRFGGQDQYLSFYLFPKNAYPAGAPYLDATSVVYASWRPPRVLELAVGNQTGNIRFNVGGYTGSNEVMRLMHLNGGHATTNLADQRVGIGAMLPVFTLQVENNIEKNTPLMVRGISDDLRTGVFTMTPRSNAVYLTYGCYLRDGQWTHDPYRYVDGSSGNIRTSDSGAKISINLSLLAGEGGAIWNYYCFNGAIPADNKILQPHWQPNYKRMWDLSGTLLTSVCPPSSRALKENFIGIGADDILGKIDQLEVSRWNYKSEDKSITHIGPVAEDFYRLFKTGPQEDELHLIDSVGVSLAGVKALSGKVSVQQRKIEEFKREIKGLRAQLGQ